ncbi:MAG TPA: four-carbon acid sugar kinase family protein [Steroidobacteraceae bacterium]|nr:four-carbon acid sugar kinase family protein [Steroidobacteraceae bacterium]
MTGRWLILADDLTGASDAGVAFARRGCATEVCWGDATPPPGIAVHARDLASRGCATQDAASRHANALRRWLEPDQAIYKKIDSTLRGQPAAEIAALCATLQEFAQPAWGLFAPANPPLKRITRDGRVLVGGEPLENTETWKRERSYASADLAAMLATAGLTSTRVPLAQVRGDAAELTAAMRAAASRGAGTMVICDAETDDDLARIAMAARAAQPGFYAGTAGLAQALAGMSGALGRRAIELPATRRGTLIAVGTPAKVTREAARKLADHLGRPPVRVCVDGEAHIDESTPGNATLSGSATRILAGGDELVLLDSARTDAVAVNPEFAETFARALREALPHAGALIASGGETAAALLGQVGVHGITLLDELEPGLALGITRGDVEVPIVTKPGAFGDAESLVRCLARLHQLQGRE